MTILLPPPQCFLLVQDLCEVLISRATNGDVVRQCFNIQFRVNFLPTLLQP